MGTIAAAGTFPTTTQFDEWVIWAEGKMKSYLQCGNTLPTDQGDILKNVADDLLYRKFKRDKNAAFEDETDGIPLPELTPENKFDLDSLRGQSKSMEPTSFNFDLNRLRGGF